MTFTARASLKSLLLSAACSLALAVDAPAFAQTQKPMAFQIAPSSLADALNAFGVQSGAIITFSSDAVAGKRAPELKGTYSVSQALDILLRGSGLSYRIGENNGVTVFPTPRQGSSSSQERAAPSDYNAPAIEEIIVTAQKREERLQDVPVPVAVLSADALTETNQVQIRDYYVSVPGLTMAPNMIGQQNLFVRGITTGAGNPSVTILVDDVPFGGATNNTAGNQVPDFDPEDLAHVEVLRGPQGTFYGANGMGGVMKFVTKDPSPDGYSGRVQVGTSSVYNGSEPGYNIRGSVNIPLLDTLAIRVSAYRRHDPGYIDDIVLNRKGVNRGEADGARLSALWLLSDDFTVKFSAMYQFKRSGISEAIDGLGDLQQNYIPGGKTDRTTQAYSATMDYKADGFDLVSVTGYNINRFSNLIDYSSLVPAALTQSTFGPGITGTMFNNSKRVEKVSQEVRASGTFASNFEWLAGAFYTHENSPAYANYYAANPVTGRRAGVWYTDLVPVVTFEEYAAFANLTYHVNDRIDVQVGGRASHNKGTTGEQAQTGPYVQAVLGLPAGPAPILANQFSGNANTYSVTPQYKISSDFMVYARVSSGYRPGTANAGNLVVQGAPESQKPDTTQNYEIGVKGDLIDRELSIDASLYHIDWKDIQISALAPVGSTTILTNGSAAKSEGVELTVTVHPAAGLTITTWGTYDNAVLTAPFPAGPLYGVPGNRLPFAPRFSGNISVEQEFLVGNEVSGFLGGQVSYQDDRLGVFRGASAGAPLARQDMPAFTKIDLHAGVKFNAWTATLYADNASDARGLVNGGLGYYYAPARIYITPRTVGLNVSKSF